MRDRKSAEVFPPGEFIKEELEARGWTQNDLAEVLGRPTRLVNELISGKRGITPETAKGLACAFATSAQLWMNLESTYRLFKSETEHDIVARRAALYTKAPIRSMIRRNWIESSKSIETMESNLDRFFTKNKIKEDSHSFAYAARKATPHDDLTIEQNAWLHRAHHLAKAMPAKAFSQPKLKEALDKIKLLLFEAEEIGKVAGILSDCGIRFLIIEPLPQSKIDGAVFWLGNSPVVVLSLRYDRIDYFWYTLMHELGHVKNEDGKNNDNLALDIDLPGNQEKTKDKLNYEGMADRFASNYLVPKASFDDFIAKTSPTYSKRKIIGFANRIKVHPGIIVGQIHYREKNYSCFRSFLTRVRHIIAAETMTDGWDS